jgi:RND family efflux transporter MFP subunit
MTEMITVGLYLILFVLVKVKVFKSWAKWMTITPIAIFVAINVMYIIPMNWVAPQGPLVIFRNSVEITPLVDGLVSEVPVRAGQRVKKGDTLFKIRDTPYLAVVDGLTAQLSLAKTRLGQASELAERKAGSLYEVQQFETQVRALEAQLTAAQFDVASTVVRAPADGVIPDVTLQVGARVSTSRAALPFIDESRRFLSVQIAQIHLRNVEVGQEAEFVLKLYPGQVFEAVVTQIIPSNPSGQLPASGLTAATPQLQSGPYWVVLDPVDEIPHIPAGAMGTAAIFTPHPPTMSHLFRKIFLRSETWKNYLIP